MENLESQLGEEPFVLALLVSLFEFGADNMTSLLFLHGILEDFLVQLVFVQSNVDAVASGHQMVIVDDLKERLDLGPLLNLLLGHAFCHNAGVPIDTGNQSMAKRFVRGTFIVGLDNDCLATSKSAGQDKDNLALFHNLAHLGVKQIFLVTP